MEYNPDKEVWVSDVISDCIDTGQVKTCKNHSDANGEDSGVECSMSDPILANHEQEVFRELVSQLCQEHVHHQEELPCKHTEDKTCSSTRVQNYLSESKTAVSEVDKKN